MKHGLGRWRGSLTRVAMAAVGLVGLVGCMPTRPGPTAAPAATLSPPQPGQVELAADEAGSHIRYVPTAPGAAPPIVVLVHGTPADDESAEDTARYYVENWQAWAEAHGAIVLAPAFDQSHFGSKEPDMVGGGYRGLFGREIGADEWVLRLVDAYRARYGGDGRFFLYGHSAGGQFAARFLVTHPERLRAAVITAALTYPQPTPDVPWPYGLGRLEATLHWTDPPAETVVDVYPDSETWLAGLDVPTAVIVGLNDLEPQLDWPGQHGNTRVAIARNWVKDMNAFAAEHGVESGLTLSLVPGLGHSAYGLLSYSQGAMGAALEN